MIGYEREGDFSKHCLTLTERGKQRQERLPSVNQIELVQSLLLATVTHQGCPSPD